MTEDEAKQKWCPMVRLEGRYRDETNSEKLPPVGKWQGWIATEDSECPVPGNSVVKIRRECDDYAEESELAGQLLWTNWSNVGQTIIAYCVTQYPKIKRSIELTPAEIQSGLDRVRRAEGLILQLPSHHDGRNSWLLNYGESEEAKHIREEYPKVKRIYWTRVGTASSIWSG